jgi:hypothetical protein
VITEEWVETFGNFQDVTFTASKMEEGNQEARNAGNF